MTRSANNASTWYQKAKINESFVFTVPGTVVVPWEEYSSPQHALVGKPCTWATRLHTKTIFYFLYFRCTSTLHACTQLRVSRAFSDIGVRVVSECCNNFTCKGEKNVFSSAEYYKYILANT